MKIYKDALMRTPQVTFILLMMLFVGGAGMLKPKETVDVDTKPLLGFPVSIGQWEGKSQAMDSDITQFLELSDYALINYKKNDHIINFYAAYYNSQEEGAFPHSPTLCIPGGGWEITDITHIRAGNYDVRRVKINKNKVNQIVYYWYQQGDRSLDGEYELKWNTFKRSLSQGRTDTSLIRLTTVIRDEESEVMADDMLVAFLNEIDPEIQQRLN